MELIKGVHVIESYAATVLLLDGRLVLVDTSAEDDAGTIVKYMDKAKVRPRDLSSIFITHTHPDHVGGLATIKRDSAAKVAAHRIEAPYISRKKDYDGPSGPQRHSGTPVDVLLEDGQAYDGLRVIFAPGHTRGSIALLDESRSLLIAGDSMRNEAGVRPMDDKYNVDPKQHRESIKRIAAFHFDAAVFGHGKPIQGGARQQIAELAKRL